MPKFFINHQNKKENEIRIEGEDVNHIKNVLRKKVGDTITICNTETEKDYLCEIIELTEQAIICQEKQVLDTNAEPNIKVSIFQGLPKADKMEWIIQKAVELGVYDITPVEMKRCIVKLTPKEKIKKIQRWQKIAEVAAKQCGRNRIPEIKEIGSISNICDLCSEYDIVLVAYEEEKENTLKRTLEEVKNDLPKDLKIAVLIGPEGGLEETEVTLLREKGAKIVTLGDRILRTETVALNLLSILMYEFERKP